MTNVQTVDREHVEAALAELERVDVDAANLLRNRIESYYLFDEMLDICEMLRRLVWRLNQLTGETRTLLAAFERAATNAGDEERNPAISQDRKGQRCPE